ncbi:MAG TPA: hypothetical protein VFA67_14765 [Candidatus Sulfotelmatobacter sp.]|nr:hypothetical protein [Candidatus Sulfotelmatobacter sp.]
MLVLLAFSIPCRFAQAQDSESLADAARQARQQKQRSAKATEGQKTTAKTPRVITNDEIPEQAVPDTASPSGTASSPEPNYPDGKRPAEYWKSQILRTRTAIASLQRNIDALNNSIRFAGGNYEKHVAWNERQREKQQEVEKLKIQLSDLQKRLEGMQEAARRQGYGSSVYEP